MEHQTLDPGAARPPLRARKDPNIAGPRTLMGGKRLRVGDLVLADTEHGTRLAQITGGYRLAGVWHVQLGQPPGLAERRSHWLPQSVKARAIKQVFCKGARKK